MSSYQVFGSCNGIHYMNSQRITSRIASTLLRSELTKPQQIFSTSAKLSSKSALICFIREGQDKYNKRIGKNYTNAENINFLLKQKINILCIGIRNSKLLFDSKRRKCNDKKLRPRVVSNPQPPAFIASAITTQPWLPSCWAR